jgi:hypothetical protein
MNRFNAAMRNQENRFVSLDIYAPEAKIVSTSVIHAVLNFNRELIPITAFNGSTV